MMIVHVQAKSTAKTSPKSASSRSGPKSESRSTPRPADTVLHSKPGSDSTSKKAADTPNSHTDQNQTSSLTLVLCPETPTLEHSITVEIVGDEDDRGTSVPITERQSPFKTPIEDNYPQKTIRKVKLTSTHESQVVCVQALVVDVTIMIDQPTEFKHNCPETPDVDDLPCRQFGDDILRPFICPQKLTDLLQTKHQINSLPEEMPTDFQPPVYDIANDMAQASAAIAEGLTEGFSNVVKNRIKVHKAAIKSQPIGKIASVAESFASFIGALGPVFSIFGGITSIVTTFLTPNPFDAIADYLNKQFEQVNERISDVQEDIADLKRLLEAQGSTLAMANQIRAIRYAVRNYGNMVDKLSTEPVCGSTSLLNSFEVEEFMRQYRDDNVDNSLIDLYEVEFGGVTEAGARLLNPYAKAYCHSHPEYLQKFAEELSFYGYAGSLAHFAYKNLACIERGDDDCDESDKDRDEWARRLHRFLKKAEVFKVAATNPPAGLWLDVRDSLETLIDEEAEKAPNTVPIPGIMDKVYEIIVDKVSNTNDWSNQCVLKVYGEDRSTLIIEVTEVRDTSFFTFDPTNVPWNRRVSHTRFWVQKMNTDRSYKSVGITCGHGEIDDCRAPGHLGPSTPPKDRVLFLMFNPRLYQAHYQLPFIVGKPHRSTFIDRRNVYAYYDNDGDSGMDGTVYVGEWSGLTETQFALIDNHQK